MVDASWSCVEIGAAMGCSASSVSRAIRRLRDDRVLPPATLTTREAEYAAMSLTERERRRVKSITLAAKGWDPLRVANAVHLPTRVVKDWLSEWGEAQKEALRTSRKVVLVPPPRDVDEMWPADAKFEDCLLAIEANKTGERIVGYSQVARYTRWLGDDRSYVGCSAAMAVA